MKLKTEGLPYDIIYARLEKAGIEHETVIHVLANLFKQNEAEEKEAAEAGIKFHFIIAGAGILFALIMGFIFPDYIFIPTSILVSSIGAAVMIKLNQDCKGRS